MVWLTDPQPYTSPPDGMSLNRERKFHSSPSQITEFNKAKTFSSPTKLSFELESEKCFEKFYNASGRKSTIKHLPNRVKSFLFPPRLTSFSGPSSSHVLSCRLLSPHTPFSRSWLKWFLILFYLSLTIWSKTFFRVSLRGWVEWTSFACVHDHQQTPPKREAGLKPQFVCFLREHFSY